MTLLLIWLITFGLCLGMNYSCYLIGRGHGRRLSMLARAKLLHEMNELSAQQTQLIDELEENVRLLQEERAQWPRPHMSH